MCARNNSTQQVVQGTAALELLFDTVGLGWAVNLMELPIVAKIIDLLYEFLSANRISLGNALVSEAPPLQTHSQPERTGDASHEANVVC